ncbi:countin-1-like [Pomacea canaliculata]|uniref:countin-1-like n=1 Tax=Pomacea canaliculata TaxID=400727 RepID=UPI000D727172|nr:countin-1-like [Pomacea canaliculata]
MKRLAVLVVALLSVHAAVPRKNFISRSFPDQAEVNHLGLDLCPTCVDFTDQTIDIILNIILNAGVVGTCADLCQLVEQKTGSEVIGAVCDILCDVAGIEEFVNLIQKADLDPIYFCELIRQCPIFDQGDAKIKDLSVSPQVGPQGHKTITFTIDSQNGTGTGELILFIETVDGIPVETGLLLEAQKPSAFPSPQSFALKAKPDPNCDPTQDFCEMWLPGNYTLIVDVCNGECGSKHPHSQVYDRKTANFTITE